MRELIIKEKQKFMGKEISVIEGGFGENKRVLTAIQISEIHDIELKTINQSIKRLINKNRLKNEVDYIDIKGNCELPLKEFGWNGRNIANAFVLSERGYSKLIKYMDDDKSWEIHDELVDKYFAMRKIINSNEQLKANLLLSIYNGGQEGIIASKQLTDIEVKEATKKLVAEVEHKEDVIVGLVSNIDLATKRQRITQIIRHGGKGKYRERYNLLYQEFEKKYHMNLNRRIKSCEIKPKVKNKMDYIDRVLNKIPELYEIVCKLFENEIKELIKEWEEVI